MTQKILPVKGMHCASCATIISKKVSKLEGVDGIDVNFATEKATINFDASKVSIEKMNNEIEKLGYTFVSENTNDEHMPAAHSQVQELESMKAKAQFAVPIALMVFVVMMWDIASRTIVGFPNLPLPMMWFNNLAMILATVVLFWIGRPFLDAVVKFMRFRVANMDTLIGIGTLVAYAYSAIITLTPQIRILLRLPEYTYFDVTIVVIGFVVLGKYLEARSKQRTGTVIQKLLGLQAKTALIIRDGAEIEVTIEDVAIGDIMIVKPGTKIPVDGKIIRGESAIDESMITGESLPVDKKIGDTVIGGTLNKQGSIQCTATQIGSQTVLARIIKMVEDAQGSKAPIQALADRISAVFVPIVLGIASLSLILWLTWGAAVLGFTLAFSYAILSFVGVLVIACPCALGLATPTAIIVGVGKGAQYGILIKNAESLEKLSKIDTVILDKTGTITKGVPTVTDIISTQPDWDSSTIIQYAASIEKLSEHPLANAIVAKAHEQKATLYNTEQFSALEGIGVTGMVDGKKILIRRPTPEESLEPKVHKLQQEGKTVVVLEMKEKLTGIIALSDTVKDGAKEAVAALHAHGLIVIMLTGDNRAAAEYIAKQVNIDSVIAEVLPAEKADKIKELQQQGKRVAMAGDGINDAPALTQADVGIAMATGTDIAIESAGITLMHGDIAKLSQAVILARTTLRTVKQNLFWAFIYNLVGLPIAAGLLYPFWGIILNPVFAGLAMAGSSVSVVLNSLRLKTISL